MTHGEDRIERAIRSIMDTHDVQGSMRTIVAFLELHKDRDDAISSLEKAIALERPDLLKILGLARYTLNPEEPLNLIAISSACFLEGNYVEAYLLVESCFQRCKTTGEFVVDSGYALVLAAAALGMEDVVFSTLKYINDVYIVFPDLNERKSGWIIDHVNEIGIDIDRSQFPNLLS